MLSFIAILGSLHSIVMIGIEVNRIYSRTVMVKHLSSEVNSLENEINNLKAVIDNKNDQAYIEQLARCIGYAYPSESRYVTIGVNSSTLSNPNCQ